MIDYCWLCGVMYKVVSYYVNDSVLMSTCTHSANQINRYIRKYDETERLP